MSTPAYGYAARHAHRRPGEQRGSDVDGASARGPIPRDMYNRALGTCRVPVSQLYSIRYHDLWGTKGVALSTPLVSRLALSVFAVLGHATQDGMSVRNTVVRPMGADVDRAWRDVPAPMTNMPPLTNMPPMTNVPPMTNMPPTELGEMSPPRQLICRR